MNPAEIVRTVCNFIRWHRERFDTLDEEHEVLANSVGYRRGEGGKRKFWIEPLVWTEELCGDEIDPQDAARKLKELGLLRTQDDNSFQIVAKVRGRAEGIAARSSTRDSHIVTHTARGRSGSSAHSRVSGKRR